MSSKFLNNIELTAGLVDNNGTSGSANQIIVSNGANGVQWDDLSAISGVVEGIQSDIIYYEVKNSSGAQIVKGKGVMAVGTDGNSGHILIDEMVADGTVQPRYFLGVLNETLNNGDIGRVIAFGEVDQINTTGQNGETWTGGQVLWCDPDSAGDFTITEPLGPNVKIPAAFILKASTSGKVQVRVQANEGLHQLHDVKITSQVDGDVLVWDNTTGVWFNDSTLNVDYTSNEVGIGTTDPDAKLHIDAPTGDFLKITESGSDRLLFDSNGEMYLIPPSNWGGYFKVGKNVGAHEVAIELGDGRTGNGYSLIDLVGDTTYTDYGLRLIRNNTGANTTSQLVHRGTGSLQFVTSDSGDILLIPNSGNVGIGTTNPTGKLEVRQDANNGNTGAFTNTHVKLTASAIADSTGFVGITAATSTADNYGYSFGAQRTSGGVGDFKINYHNNSAAGTNRFIIDQSGNVGIGTTSPDSKLEVASTDTNTYLHVRNDSTGSTRLKMSNLSDTNSNGFQIINNGSDGQVNLLNYKASTLALWTNNSQRMTILSGGNVGIGTTSPSNELDVSGNIEASRIILPTAGTSGGGTVTTPAGKLDIRSDSTWSNSAIIARETTNQNPVLAFYRPSGTAALSYPWHLEAQSSNFHIKTGSSANIGSETVSEKVTISNAGNVGISTTSPQSKLHVANGTLRTWTPTAGTTAIFESTQNSRSFITITGASESEIWFGDGTTQTKGRVRYENNNNMMEFWTNTSPRMYINSSGNVGIGTDSPGKLLELSGTANVAAIRLRDTTSNTWDIQNSTFGKLDFIRGGTNTYMRIDQGGNVGINTTTPKAKLDVNGAVRVGSDLSTASSTNVGAIRYIALPNESRVDMVMQTGASTYAWVNIVTNTW